MRKFRVIYISILSEIDEQISYIISFNYVYSTHRNLSMIHTYKIRYYSSFYIHQKPLFNKNSFLNFSSMSHVRSDNFNSFAQQLKIENFNFIEKVNHTFSTKVHPINFTHTDFNNVMWAETQHCIFYASHSKSL